MNEQDVEIYQELIASIAIALLGEVTPSLRAIGVDWRNRTIKAVAYYDGEITEADLYLAKVMEAEIAEDFESGWRVLTQVVRRDFPLPIEAPRAWAYRRKEAS